MGKLIVVLVLLLVAGAGGGWFWFQSQVAEASKAAKAEAEVVGAERIARPLFAPPLLKGGFAECAEGRLKSNTDLLASEPEACRAFRAPKGPPGKMPDECLKLVTPTNALAWARGLMTCSHSDHTGEPIDPARYAGWLTAAKVVAWEVRDQAAQGQVGAAFETCLDTFGTARDLIPHGESAGLDAADAIVRTVYPACSDAVIRADGISRASFAGALEKIRASWWTNAKLIRDERVIQAAKPADGIAAQWEFVQARKRLIAVEALSGTSNPERGVALKAIEGAGPQAAMLDKAEALEGLVEMLAAASSEAKAPASTARFTVLPGASGALFTPVEPASAPLAIQLLR